jgi:hypothetical protein
MQVGHIAIGTEDIAGALVSQDTFPFSSPREEEGSELCWYVVFIPLTKVLRSVIAIFKVKFTLGSDVEWGISQDKIYTAIGNFCDFFVKITVYNAYAILALPCLTYRVKKFL